MTKEQLQKLYNLELITLVTGEDVLLDEIKDMEIEEALIHLKKLEIFNHVIDNDEILNLLGNDVNVVAEDSDDVTKSTTKEDDVTKSTTKEDEDDDSPIVDDGE